MNKNMTKLKYQLLIVEDHKINQEIIIGLLSDLDLEMDIAENGEEALEKINKKSII